LIVPERLIFHKIRRFEYKKPFVTMMISSMLQLGQAADRSAASTPGKGRAGAGLEQTPDQEVSIETAVEAVAELS
jgi:hypothetical protein